MGTTSVDGSNPNKQTIKLGNPWESAITNALSSAPRAFVRGQQAKEERKRAEILAQQGWLKHELDKQRFHHTVRAHEDKTKNWARTAQDTAIRNRQADLNEFWKRQHELTGEWDPRAREYYGGDLPTHADAALRKTHQHNVVIPQVPPGSEDMFAINYAANQPPNLQRPSLTAQGRPNLDPTTAIENIELDVHNNPEKYGATDADVGASVLGTNKRQVDALQAELNYMRVMQQLDQGNTERAWDFANNQRTWFRDQFKEFVGNLQQNSPDNIIDRHFWARLTPEEAGIYTERLMYLLKPYAATVIPLYYQQFGEGGLAHVISELQSTTGMLVPEELMTQIVHAEYNEAKESNPQLFQRNVYSPVVPGINPNQGRIVQPPPHTPGHEDQTIEDILNSMP